MIKTETKYFQIETLCPVLVGAGHEYNLTDYVIDQKTSDVLVFDPVRLIGALSSAEREKLLRCCRDGDARRTLQNVCNFYQSLQLLIEREALVRRIKSSPEFADTRKRRLNEPEKYGQRLKQFNLFATSYNTFTNEPILPGSSVKGALRTAVLNNISKVLNSSLRSNRNARKMEQYLLAEGRIQDPRFSSDPFSLCEVSDFVPTAAVATSIVRVIRRKKNTGSKERGAGDGRGVSAFCEVIPAGTCFVGTFGLEDPARRLGEVASPLTFESLLQAMRSFYGNELGMEKSDLEPEAKPLLRDLNVHERPIRIGRYSGALCMTVEGYRQIKPSKGYKGHPEKYRPLEIGCVELDKRDYRMNPLLGWCAVREIKAEEYEGIVARERRFTIESIPATISTELKEWEIDIALAHNPDITEEQMKQLLDRLMKKAWSKEYGKNTIEQVGTGCKKWILDHGKKDLPEWSKSVKFLMERLGQF